MCRKVPIPTQGEALRVKRNRGMRVTHAYHCHECDAWHVTSMSRNTYKRIRGRR